MGVMMEGIRVVGVTETTDDRRRWILMMQLECLFIVTTSNGSSRRKLGVSKGNTLNVS